MARRSTAPRLAPSLARSLVPGLVVAAAVAATSRASAQLPPPPPPPPGQGLPPPSSTPPSSTPPSSTPPSSLPPPQGGGGAARGREHEPAPRREEPRRRRERERDRDDDRVDGYAGDAPPAHVGFQIALRTGLAVPLGSVEGNTSMGDFASVQLPLVADIGGKPIPNLFLGGYVGVGFGGPAGNASTACDRGNLSCTAVRGTFGIQVQYHILPEAKVNPWVGFGFGYEVLGLSRSRGNASSSSSVSGFEFAHLLFGVDFRVSRIVGVGPFLDFSVGQYGRFSNTDGNRTVSGDIGNTAVHEWLTLGVRVVFWP